VVGVFGREAQKIDVIEGAADVFAVDPLAAELDRKFGAGARGIDPLLS